MTALQILAAIVVALGLDAMLAITIGAFIDAGMHPRRGEGGGQRARQDRGEGGEFRTIHRSVSK